MQQRRQVETEPARTEPVEPEAGEAHEICSDCEHPYERKVDGLKVHGHSRKIGKCDVVGCDCEAFLP